MSATPALLTLTYLIPVSTWWFTQLSVQPSSSGLFSLRVLETLLITQLLCLSLFLPQWIESKDEIRQHATSIAASLLPCWPLIALLWLATGVSVLALVVWQVVAVVIGLAVALVALALQRFRVDDEPLRLMQSSLGLVAATFVFVTSADWLQWAVR
jgi:hypothetical protein